MKTTWITFGAFLAFSMPAFAQTGAAAPAPFTLDLTGIIVAVVGGVFSIIAIVATALINKTISDENARAAFNLQVKNSLGALQQASDGIVVALNPSVAIRGVPANLQPAAQYVLDHAGAEAAQLGVDGPMLASHIQAAIGLNNLAASVTGRVPVPPPGKNPP